MKKLQVLENMEDRCSCDKQHLERRERRHLWTIVKDEGYCLAV